MLEFLRSGLHSLHDFACIHNEEYSSYSSLHIPAKIGSGTMDDCAVALHVIYDRLDEAHCADFHEETLAVLLEFTIRGTVQLCCEALGGYSVC
jgi:hypothetical protein